MRTLLAGLFLALVAAACSSAATQSGTVAPTSTITPVTTTSIPTSVPITTVPPTTTTANGTTLTALKGTGTTSTSDFAVPAGTSEWDITSSFACSSSEPSGFTAWVDVSVFDSASNQPDVTDPQTNTRIATSGTAIGRYHDTGTFYLTITGPCPWSVRAFIP